MGDKIRIAQILPDISNLGGLATRSFEQHNIFNSLKDVKADFFKLTKKRGNDLKEKEIEITHSIGGLSVKQYEISYHSNMVQESIKHLNRYDILWFNHACPHMNTDGQPDSKLWQKIFTETKAKKLVVISDVFMPKYYPWLIEVIPSVHIVLGIGHGHENSVKPYFDTDGILEHSFDLDKVPKFIYGERRGLVWAHQWRAWKGIRTYLQICRQLNEPTKFYGLGQEYYFIRKDDTDLIRNCIGKDQVSKKTWNDKSESVVYGTVHPEKVLKSYTKAKLAVDLTGITGDKYVGHYNRATLEPMLYGCVMACSEHLVQPNTHIPRECVEVIDYIHVDKAAKELNTVLKKDLNTTARKAEQWIREYHNGKKVLRSKIDLVLDTKSTHETKYVYKNGILQNKRGISNFFK